MSTHESGNGRWQVLAQILLGVLITALISIQVFVLSEVKDLRETIIAGRAERLATLRKTDAEIRDIQRRLEKLEERRK